MGAPRSLWKIAVTLMLQLRAHKVISTHWAQDNKEGYYSPLTVNHSKEVEVKKKKKCVQIVTVTTLSFVCIFYVLKPKVITGAAAVFVGHVTLEAPG